jgi:hypothetical protein
LKKNKSGKLKYLFTDTSFIRNECSKTANFGQIKKKKCSKLSIIASTDGTIISSSITKGSISDHKLVHKNLDEIFVNIESPNNNNKHKRYFMGDAGYDSKNTRKRLIDMGITPLIWSNMGNTKDKNKIKNKKMTKKQIVIYKKRMTVEHVFSWLFKNRRLSKHYDKNDSTYMAFFFMGALKILLKRF